MFGSLSGPKQDMDFSHGLEFIGRPVQNYSRIGYEAEPQVEQFEKRAKEFEEEFLKEP